jgi:hypothetical protein
MTLELDQMARLKAAMQERGWEAKSDEGGVAQFHNGRHPIHVDLNHPKHSEAEVVDKVIAYLDAKRGRG